MRSWDYWLRIELSYAVFAVAIKAGIVVDAAPIARWMIGKARLDVEAWVRRKSGIIVELRQ